MNFKKSKQDVINEARSHAAGEMSQWASNMKYNSVNNSNSSNFDQLSYAVSRAIDRAIESIVNNIYTDEEFEKDLTLKP